MFTRYIPLKFTPIPAGAFARPTLFFWFIAAAVVLPFMLSTIGVIRPDNLPWHFQAMVALLLLVAISGGFWRFTRKSQESGDSSINPAHR